MFRRSTDFLKEGKCRRKIKFQFSFCNADRWVTGSATDTVEAIGAFHSMKHSALNFQKFSLTNQERHFLEFLEKWTTLPGRSKFSEFSYWEQTFHLTFLQEYKEFSVERFASQKFKTLRTFWKLTREILVLFIPVSKSKFRIIGWMGSALFVCVQCSFAAWSKKAKKVQLYSPVELSCSALQLQVSIANKQTNNLSSELNK